MQTLSQQIEPSGPVDQAIGDEAEGDLRDRTVEGGAEQDAAPVGYREQPGRLAGQLFNIRLVDPDMTGTDAVRCAAGDDGCRALKFSYGRS